MIDALALFSSIRTTIDIARSAKDVSDQARVDAAMTEITQKLMEIQQQNQSLFDENKRLKDKIENDKRFDRYRLEKTEGGEFILGVRSECLGEGEPLHFICFKCREDGFLSPLSESKEFYRCDRCHGSYRRVPPRPPQSRGSFMAS
ncbi:MAG: hypothetical protein U9Q35_09770 [Pseudomonadota bacterium]|nr:hypothetical protein [Pseudomonadota bacterium]